MFAKESTYRFLATALADFCAASDDEPKNRT